LTVTVDNRAAAERISTVVIGGGQAGLSIGYHLAGRGIPFVIFDENLRIGDSWRNRWDSLRLFTRAGLAGLDGMPFPAPAHTFPSKDQMADFLESYATRFDLPVMSGVRVDGVSLRDGRYVVRAGDRRYEADNVVVATGGRRRPRIPAFAGDLDPGIVQFHSSAYRNPGQLRQGDTLVVGAGNSGAEIAREVAARGHCVVLSGSHTGHIPINVDGFFGRHLLVPFFVGVVFRRLLTTDTAIGRKVRPVFLSRGSPLVRVKPRDLVKVGVERGPRTAAVRDGLPVLADGRVIDPANVIWCTGFGLDFTWIDLPTIAGQSEPEHERGVVRDAAGLYFVGLPFLYSLISELIKGVGTDAQYIADRIAARVKSGRPDA
jgi:putative flavoprotein involved in K+ transport